MGTSVKLTLLALLLSGCELLEGDNNRTFVCEFKCEKCEKVTIVCDVDASSEIKQQKANLPGGT